MKKIIFSNFAYCQNFLMNNYIKIIPISIITILQVGEKKA